MSSVLLKNATLIDPEAGSERLGSLAIVEGMIADSPAPGCPEIDCAGLCLAPGIVDIGVKICEPGERHKESFRSAGLAAAAGGITTMVTRPDTYPPIDTPETLEFVLRRANEASAVRIAPMATLTKGRQGREMTEIGFLKDAGAIAFTDCDTPIIDSRILTRAMTYARNLGALIIAHPQDPWLSNGAVATGGALATTLGLSGVSPLAEKIGLARDLALIEMTGAAYHADQITTARALPALERAKEQGLDVTAGTSIHHIGLNEDAIRDYRTFFKIKPPLRREADRLATIEALASGLIDTLSSMHTPQDEESKRLPFEGAASGAIGLETLLPAALGIVREGHISRAMLWRALSLNPARRLGLPQGRLSSGAPADLVLFDPDQSYTLDRTTLLSKSKNTPFDGVELTGRVMRTWVAGREVFTRT